MQLLSGTQLDPDQKAARKSLVSLLRIEAFRCVGKARPRKSLAIAGHRRHHSLRANHSQRYQYTTELHYEILQAGVPRLTIQLPVAQSLTRVQGEQIRDCRPKQQPPAPHHRIHQAGRKSYSLLLYSEQTIDSTPTTASLISPQPLEIEREAGSFTIAADDMLVEIDSAPDCVRSMPRVGRSPPIASTIAPSLS